MRKLLSLFVAILVLFASASAIAADSYYEKHFDVLHRSLKMARMDVSLPVCSSYEFIARYAYDMASQQSDEPASSFTDITEVYSESVAKRFSYAYSFTLDDCSIYYDNQMNLLYYEVKMFNSQDDVSMTPYNVMRVVKFIRCLEAGTSSFSKTLASAYGTTITEMVSPLASDLFALANRADYDGVMYNTGNFTYIVQKYSIPAYSDKPAYDTFHLIAFPSIW